MPHLRGVAHLSYTRDAFFMPDSNNISYPVILFDGVCNLCSSAVQFVIKRDQKNIFRFASLQSSFGQGVLKKHHLPADDFNSFVLVSDEKIYTKSTGALLVAKQLSWPWKMLYPLIIIPAFIRNAVYNLIAINRYKWFGKKNACWIPTSALKARFFD